MKDVQKYYHLADIQECYTNNGNFHITGTLYNETGGDDWKPKQVEISIPIHEILSWDRKHMADHLYRHLLKLPPQAKITVEDAE